MPLPNDSVAANTLPEVTTIPTGKKLIFTDPDTNEGGIITLENLTKQILQNLTSQTFSLDQGTKTLVQALNELNSKIFPQNYITHGSDSIIPHENISIDNYSRIMAFGIITIVCIKFIANSPIEAWETIATLPVTNNKAESMGYITGNNMIYASGKSNKIVSVNTLGAGEYAGLLVF